jgi:hypothetical protein
MTTLDTEDEDLKSTMHNSMILFYDLQVLINLEVMEIKGYIHQDIK